MFPNLTLKSGGVLHSEATGVPQNGVNTFQLGMNPNFVNPDWLEIVVYPLGPSVKGASLVGISPDKTQISINFTQEGADQARVTAEVKHSIVR